MYGCINIFIYLWNCSCFICFSFYWKYRTLFIPTYIHCYYLSLCLFTVSQYDTILRDTSKVVNMGYAFSRTAFNQTIDSWDTGSVTTLKYTFYDTPFNHDLRSWDTSQVTSLSNTFAYCSEFNGDVATWDVSSVTSMEVMFYDNAFSHDLRSWDTSSVQNMYGFLREAAFNSDISSWDTSSVTTLERTFQDCLDFNQNISDWYVWMY